MTFETSPFSRHPLRLLTAVSCDNSAIGGMRMGFSNVHTFSNRQATQRERYAPNAHWMLACAESLLVASHRCGCQRVTGRLNSGVCKWFGFLTKRPGTYAGPLTSCNAHVAELADALDSGSQKRRFQEVPSRFNELQSCARVYWLESALRHLSFTLLRLR